MTLKKIKHCFQRCNHKVERHIKCIIKRNHHEKYDKIKICSPLFNNHNFCSLLKIQTISCGLFQWNQVNKASLSLHLGKKYASTKTIVTLSFVIGYFWQQWVFLKGKTKCKTAREEYNRKISSHKANVKVFDVFC